MFYLQKSLPRRKAELGHELYNEAELDSGSIINSEGSGTDPDYLTVVYCLSQKAELGSGEYRKAELGMVEIYYIYTYTE